MKLIHRDFIPAVTKLTCPGCRTFGQETLVLSRCCDLARANPMMMHVRQRHARDGGLR